MTPISAAIVGSCVSRDPFSFLAPPDFRVTSYLARQSLAGLAGPALPYDPKWYETLNPFERRCVVADLEKNGDYWRFERDCDVLVLDYIDERFGLLSVGPALVSDTKHVRQPGFEATFSPRRIARDTDEAFELWTMGAAIFLERAKRALPERRIVLHEAYWAPAFRDACDRETPLPPQMEAARVRNNQTLRRLYEYTTRRIPSASIIRPSQAALFADPEHRWSKEPFHYIRAYYEEFLRQLRAIIVGFRDECVLKT